MSKSLGNMYTLEDLAKLGHKAEAVRYVLAGGYYRRPLNFTLSSLEDAKAALNRMAKFDAQLRTAAGTDTVPSYDEFRTLRSEPGIFPACLGQPERRPEHSGSPGSRFHRQ